MEKIKKSINFIIYSIITLSLIATTILEYLCKTKMGVYRYIIAKSIKLEKYIHTQFILFIKIMFIIFIISSIAIIIFKNKKSSKRNLILICILSIVGYVISINESNLRCYYFFLIVIFIDIIFLYIQFGINKFTSKVY